MLMENNMNLEKANKSEKYINRIFINPVISKYLFLALILIGFTGVPAFAGSRAIDFEDDVVEGMNKQPLDSANQFGNKGKKKYREHLYKKRVSFRHENEILIQQWALQMPTERD